MKCLKETGKGPPGDGPKLFKKLEENYFRLIKCSREFVIMQHNMTGLQKYIQGVLHAFVFL